MGEFEVKAALHYSAAEMRQVLRYLESVFDIVRLVAPAETCVLVLEENGQIRREPHTCFRVWNKESRCANCSSMYASIACCNQSKYELMKDNVYYVLSRPVVLETEEGELPVVLEIVNCASKEMELDTENGASLANWMEDVRQKLYRDELTGVFNRRYLNEFSFLYKGQAQVSQKIGVIMLDLKRFKHINDTQGHLAGDRVLERVARTMEQRVRSQDSVVRFGGDEFVVILTDCTEETVRQKMEELRRAVEEIAPADFGYAYTAEFWPETTFLTELLDQADRRMYEEKHQHER